VEEAPQVVIENAVPGAIDFSQQIGGQMVEDIQLQFAIEDLVLQEFVTGVDGISSQDKKHSANEKSNFCRGGRRAGSAETDRAACPDTFQQQFETRRLPVVVAVSAVENAADFCAILVCRASAGGAVWPPGVAGTQGAERTLIRVQDHHLRDRGRSC